MDVASAGSLWYLRRALLLLIPALAEPPLGLRQQVCINFGPQEPGVRVFFHKTVDFPLGLVKA